MSDRLLLPPVADSVSTPGPGGPGTSVPLVPGPGTTLSSQWLPKLPKRSRVDLAPGEAAPPAPENSKKTRSEAVHLPWEEVCNVDDLREELLRAYQDDEVGDSFEHFLQRFRAGPSSTSPTSISNVPDFNCCCSGTVPGSVEEPASIVSQSAEISGSVSVLCGQDRSSPSAQIGGMGDAAAVSRSEDDWAEKDFHEDLFLEDAQID